MGGLEVIYFFEARRRGSSVLSLGDSLIRGLMVDTSLRIPPGHEGVAWERAEDGDGGEEGGSPGACATPLSSGLHREVSARPSHKTARSVAPANVNVI